LIIAKNAKKKTIKLLEKVPDYVFYKPANRFRNPTFRAIL